MGHKFKLVRSRLQSHTDCTAQCPKMTNFDALGKFGQLYWTENGQIWTKNGQIWNQNGQIWTKNEQIWTKNEQIWTQNEQI